MALNQGGSRGGSEPLRILHVMRAPVGGLFRHVADLARRQTALGHRVGIVADATTGGERGEAALRTLGSELAFGVRRVPMSRHIGASDVSATRTVAAHAREMAADVVHGHGAKGGAYARLPKLTGAIKVYTPHGGSLHYSRTSPIGFLYLTLERVLARRTDLMLFESAFGRDAFAAKVGEAGALVRVVHNGVAEAEFAPISPAADATDLVFVGELRDLKGVDLLIAAVEQLRRGGTPVTATIVGAGADEASLRAQVDQAGLRPHIHFAGAMPAREAFARGRILVVPSRAESLPYIVLEGAAAGLPVIATKVGGIGEIFGSLAPALVLPDDSKALAAAIAQALRDPAAAAAQAQRLQARVRENFSVEAMTQGVLAAYREVLAGR